MRNTFKDYPFKEICEAVDKIAKAGGACFQKWTCDGCGERVMAETPNYFTLKGHCVHCNHITNIEKKGCNYLAVVSVNLDMGESNEKVH